MLLCVRSYPQLIHSPGSEISQHFLWYFCNGQRVNWVSMVDSLQLSLILSGIALLASLVALGLLLRGAGPHRHPVLEKRLRELDGELVDVLDSVDKLTKVAKRKYSRDVARKNREQPKPDDMTDEEWKRQMNLGMATGTIRRPI